MEELQTTDLIRQAHVMMAQRRVERKQWAEAIWLCRKLFPENGLRFHELVAVVRTRVGRVSPPEKPTAENLLAEAHRNAGYAGVQQGNPLSNEYYTACGYDDYLYEQRRESREVAALAYQGALLLGAERNETLDRLLEG